MTHNLQDTEERYWMEYAAWRMRKPKLPSNRLKLQIQLEKPFYSPAEVKLIIGRVLDGIKEGRTIHLN